MLEGKTISVVIPAAGAGKRMGSVQAKQFLELNGKPVLVHTLSRFQFSDIIDEIIVAVSDEYLPLMTAMKETESLSKVVQIVKGGAERQDSVWNGIQKSTGDVILVHDAVRPFISGATIRQVADAAVEFGSAIVAVRAKETIKLSDGGENILSTPERKNLWVAQTPQAFSRSILLEAFKGAQKEGFYGTDEAMLVERMGIKVRIVEGSYDNIKITTPEDLEVAGGIWERLL